tara:strand:- start:19934 stop:20236 length:303 start_codon:yes stop_codon:yes gene_type:complete
LYKVFFGRHHQGCARSSALYALAAPSTPKLSPAEKSLFTRRRKEAYLALHPETGHGGDRKSDQADNLSTRSYADDQSAKTGVDARTVDREPLALKRIILF